MFNPREQVTILVIIVFFIYGLSIKSVRELVPGILKSFFKLVYHPIFMVIFLYIVLVFSALYLNSIIEFELVKDYIIWILFGLFPLISKVVSSFATISLMDIFKNTFKLSIVPLFIMNEYTMPFIGEILLVPIAMFIGLLLAVANTDEKYLPVQKLFNFFMIVIGVIVVIVALRGFILNLSDTKQIDFWQKMFIDIIGIALHIPLLFLVRLMSFYEQIIIRTNINGRVRKVLALLVLFHTCGINILKLSKNLKNYRLRQANTLEQFKNTLLSSPEES